MSSRKRLRAQHFSAYLQQAGSILLPRQRRAMALAAALGLLGPGVVLSFGLLAVEWWQALLAAIISVPACIAAGAAWAARSFQPRNDEERRQKQERDALESFRRLAAEKTLHKKLDPEALAILEAAAQHRARVKALAESGAQVGARAGLRLQADQAAEAAMRELAVLLSGCIGDQGREPKDDLGDIWDDLTEGDFKEAISGFRDFLASRPEDYAHRSPSLEIVRIPAIEIAERIRSLAAQLERMKADSILDVEGERPASAAGIDRLLQEMRAVEQAEEELRLNG
jgi:hypothetical protein